jgi:cyclic pyranopterin phosphate synthase
MQDRFGRTISYLRVSVTDRCNLRCRYCMPEGGVALLGHDEILSLEEIYEVVSAAAAMGVTKVRLTGGEPLVRRGIVDLVKLIAGIDGVQDFGLTTNGILLADYADELAAAGLGRINVSIDTLSPLRFKDMTRGGDIDKVFAGIDAAEKAGLLPIKLNCVVGEFSNEEDTAAVKAFGVERGFDVRTIRMMDFKSGSFSVVEGGSGGDCENCNRLRLSSDGHIRPCLFSDKSFSVRKLGADKALREAIKEKPECGGPCEHNWMHGIGG